MSKPKHIKPGIYTLYYEFLKDIAKEYGFNLVLHGSVNRDLDLIAIPWRDNLTHDHEQLMIKEFQCYLTGKEVVNSDNSVHYTILPGGRHSYVIDVNRGDKHGEWVRYEDSQYYLDISVTPILNDIS